jgi:arylsulfatase A-like enzyme
MTASFDNLINFSNRPKWFARGYEYHVCVTPGTHRMVGADVLHHRLFPWLEQHKDEDFFLFVHYWDVHGPYLAPGGHGADYPGQKLGDQIPVHTAASGEEYVRGWGSVAAVEERPGSDWAPSARTKIDTYDGGINYFDEMFGRLLDHLDALGIGQQALVALTADHGESMAEHRVPFAHDELYDATIGVPLIVRAPGKLPAGGVVKGISQAVDIAPTLVDLAGLQAPESMQGKSLVPLATGQTERLHERSYSEWTRYLASRCVKDERYKLIHKFAGGLALARPTPRRVSWVELFDVQRDPDETHNLADELPEVRKQMEEQLRDWVHGQLAPGEQDPLERPELACWEPGGRASTPGGARTGGALSLLPPERNPWL